MCIRDRERKEAELDAQYKAEDIAEITGRCATCKEKCKWYTETVKELKLQWKISQKNEIAI